MVEVRDLTKRYGPFTALQSVSFNVGQGQVVGLLGPNGAGKTTTMKILTTFMPQCSGTARIGGFDTLENPIAVRQLVGYLPESNPLHPEMTVRETLEFVAAVREIRGKERSGAVARMADICRLQGVIDQPVGQLSKGYRQRVGLAQAMIHDPQVLILDEPTSGLDPNQIVDMLALIRELGRNKTVIHSTHILSEAEHTCDRVLILSRGCLVADDRPDNLARAATGHALSLRLEGEVPEAETRIAALSWVQSVRRNGVFYEIELKEKRDMGAELSAFCYEQNWRITALTYRSPGLEQVFAHLTRRGGEA